MLNRLSLLDGTVNKACSNHQGMLCGDEDWGSGLKCVSRVRLDKEVSVLVAEAVYQAFGRICVFPQESLQHTDSLKAVKLHSEQQTDRERVIKECRMVKF